jgi:hypothetical protein
VLLQPPSLRQAMMPAAMVPPDWLVRSWRRLSARHQHHQQVPPQQRMLARVQGWH